MAWIEYHTALRDHWKIKRLAGELEVDYLHALGAISCLWLWVAEYAPDGNVTRFTDAEIRDAARCNLQKFSIEALKTCELVDTKGRINDWSKHGLKLLKSRNDRVRKFRKEGGGDPKKWTATRVRVLKRDNYTCVYCGRLAMVVDHVIPLTQGGSSDDENLVASCKKCNLAKNNRTPQEAFAKGLISSPGNVTQCHTVTPTKPTIPNQPNQPIKTCRFSEIWVKYPNKDGRKLAERFFLSSVKTDQDFADISRALENYLVSEKVKKGYIKNGSTWFNNWRDWVVPPLKEKTGIEKYIKED